MKRSLTSGLVLLVAAIFLGGGLAMSSETGMSTQKESDQGSLTMEEAIALAKQAHPGKVLEAELEKEDKGAMYEVKIAGLDGKTREIEIDVNTGKIVDTEFEEEEENEDK